MHSFPCAPCLSEKDVISLFLSTELPNIYHICQCSYGTELDKEHNHSKKKNEKLSQSLNDDVALWHVFILLTR